MRMNLGNLMDLVQEHSDLKQRVADAELAIQHGGNAHTMKCKHEQLQFCVDELELFRGQPINVEVYEAEGGAS